MTLLSLLVAVAVSAGDPYFDDAGLPLPPNTALTSQGSSFVGAWTSTVREDAFGNTGALAPRGPELWTNIWRPDGGLHVPPHGALLCPAAAGESFSEPRVAAVSATQLIYVWRVARTDTSTPGHQLRVAFVDADGVPSSCSSLLVADTGEDRWSLQVATSGGKAYVLWETAAALEGTLVGSGQIQNLYSKSSGAGAFRPSLTGLASGFQALWVVGSSAYSAELTQAGAPVWLSEILAGNSYGYATVTGSDAPFAALISNSGMTNSGVVWVAPVVSDGGLSRIALLSGGAYAPPLAAMAGATLFVTAAHGAVSLQYDVIRGLNPGSGVTLPAGDRPEAMASGSVSAGILSRQAGELRAYSVDPGPASSLNPVSPLGITRRDTVQRSPSAGWVEPEGWLVPWWEPGLGAAGARIVRLDAGVSPLAARASAGAPRMLTAASGNVAGLTISDPINTVLYKLSGATIDPSGLTSVVVGPAGHDSSALGSSISVLWQARNRSFYVVRGGAGMAATISTGVVGRCGAFMGGSLWIPVINSFAGGNASLTLLEFPDTMTTAAADLTEHVVAAVTARGNSPPCIAANESVQLVAWANLTNQLQLALVSRASGSLSVTVLPLPSPVSPVRDVVVAAVSGGWQVAWESPGAVSSLIGGLRVSKTGVIEPPVNLGFGGFDERAPWLAAAPNGQALLTWSEFVPAKGTTLVRHRIVGMPYPSPTDAGVKDAGVDAGLSDAGTPDAGDGDAGTSDAGDGDAGTSDAGDGDAGTSDAGDGDAGTSDAGPPDGGDDDGGTARDGGPDISTPLEFSSCGCSADGASALSLLALAALARRRRS